MPPYLSGTYQTFLWWQIFHSLNLIIADEGGSSFIFLMLPFYLIQYALSQLWSINPSLLWYIFSTLLVIIRSAMFNPVLLLLSNMFDLIQSNQICSLWSDIIQSDPIQSNIIFSLLFDPLTMFCYDPRQFGQPKPIQPAISLFPYMLSPLCSSKLQFFLK